jgi:hypothetical protein
MRARGITYDTGFLPGERSTRPHPSDEATEAHMRMIKRQLHCDAVRISGTRPEAVLHAAPFAAAEGLEVWISPFPVDATPDEAAEVAVQCARGAEELRRGGTDVVLVVGCEATGFLHGIVAGDSYDERFATIASADLAWWQAEGPGMLGRFGGYLADTARRVRAVFGGRVTYAAGSWELVDWDLFDIVAVDAYRGSWNTAGYHDEVRALTGHGKPAAVTEFGTCAYTGAGELGGMAWKPPADAVRDEEEQVRYFSELLDVFEAQGIDTAFWYTFASFDKTGERDIASYGVIALPGDPEGAWTEKAICRVMAERYRR